MLLRYVWKNFRRRRVRTALMLISLVISVALVVTLSATVETISRSNVTLVANETGRHDVSITRTDISQQQFIDVDAVANAIADAHPSIDRIQPRFETQVELEYDGQTRSAYLAAVDLAVEPLDTLTVVSGTLPLAPQTAFMLEESAFAMGVGLGDVITVAYDVPQARPEGEEAPAGISQRRAVAQFTVAAIGRQSGLINASRREGIIVNFDDTQQWLGLTNQASRLVVTVDPSLYDDNDASTAALSIRDVVAAMSERLDDTYAFDIEKARIIDGIAQAFLVAQALINLYGLTSLGIVGLLVYTLVMTNVQEQQREMAILRILGSHRRYLFLLVIGEVAVIGTIAMIIGVLAGQGLTTYVVTPLIERFAQNNDITLALTPEVTGATIIPAVISAAIVLLISAFRPAQAAARTKILHAINPGVADNIQLEDLASLRERGPTTRLFFIGMLMCGFVVMILGLQLVSVLGNPAVEASIFFAALVFMVLGIGFIFFITAVPFERLIMLLTSFVAPRATFFARRNVSRGQTRNTLISMLVLFSAILPSFLATTQAMDAANTETNVKLTHGAPLDMRIFGGEFNNNVDGDRYRLTPADLNLDIAATAGIEEVIGVSYDYNTRATDSVGFRGASVRVKAVSGPLDTVLYPELIGWTVGNNDVFQTILREPNTIIISEGLATFLAVENGDTIKLTGNGLDNVVDARVAGIITYIPGFENMRQGRVTANGSEIIASPATFNRLITPPNDPFPAPTEPLYTRVLGTFAPDADQESIGNDLRFRYGNELPLWLTVFTVRMANAEQEFRSGQIFLLALTMISFTTAVVGVFAVVYVTVYARRVELGMMKAVGMQKRDIIGMLTIEAIAMTLSAALAGITAGTVMGLAISLIDTLGQGRPYRIVLDSTVSPFIVFMVVVASIIGTLFSARRIIKHKAIQILRMA